MMSPGDEEKTLQVELELVGPGPGSTEGREQGAERCSNRYTSRCDW